MKKVLLVYGALVAILVIIAIFRNNIFSAIPNPFGGSPQVQVKNQTFNVELANNDKKRQTGLSGRDKLADNQGMLFLFNGKGVYSFWMRDMKFPIDIIFINDTKVVDIIPNAQPPEANTPVSEIPILTPEAEANYVLEVNAGLAEKYGIKEGDTVTLRNVK